MKKILTTPINAEDLQDGDLPRRLPSPFDRT